MKLNILSYRHAAIAISRVHLKCGGFKRDYSSTDDAAFNEQASHGSWIAGTVREWHGFLGFETYLGPRKRAWQQDQDQDIGLAKRPCITIDIDQD
ncbi:hypothetical protein ASPCAL14200 [Aspergillus calidoustus]|uniref:Uncharacterized protein n=1 Tax=Aspergillus calidoustus TaxID=454130 RepID=A0A0U4ZP45_ASPCI|nr:hypothetical protein ASPCAL14200 [Aspergillus calidoustus]